MDDNKIDFVITWVDGNDSKWLVQRRFFDNFMSGDSSAIRFRDWGLLKYWFRGVEEFAPWVNKIHFVTWGHLPEWLDISHPKLNIVKHIDFIPKQYLPTFNSNVIELNLHCIQGLSENFVYFNDDMFLLQPVKKENFFVKNFPCDSAVLTALQPTEKLIDNIIFNNIKIINKYFDKAKIKSRFFSLKYGKYNLKSLFQLPFDKYSSFHNFHCHLNLKKSTLSILWEKEYTILDNTCNKKFRTQNDVNIWLARYWQLASGEFVNTKVNDGYYEINNQQVQKIISKQQKISICLNDVIESKEIKDLRKSLGNCFKKILPKVSQFEMGIKSE